MINLLIGSNKNYNMSNYKKSLIITLIFVVSIIVAGCKKTGEQIKNDEQNEKIENLGTLVDSIDNEIIELKKEVKDGLNESKKRIDKIEMSDVDNWITFKIEKLGMEFEYPEILGEAEYNQGTNYHILSFSNKDYSFSLSGVTKDFSAPRGATNRDMTGFEKDNNKYYINYIYRKIKIVPKKVINNNIILLDCMSYEEKCEFMGPTAALSSGSLGVVINIPEQEKYTGLFSSIGENSIPKKVFVGIINSIKFIK